MIRQIESRFPHVREVPTSARWLVAGSALASVIVFAVTAALLDDRPSAVDLDVDSSVEERPDRNLILLPMKVLALASSARGSFVLLLVVGLYFAIRRSDWRPAMLVGTAFVGVAALTAVLKMLFDRPTPVGYAAGELSGTSFPSGHMAQAVAVWGIIAIVVAMGRTVRTRQIVTVSAVLLIGGAAASRLILEAHWLTDVIAGTALGVLWLAIVATVALWMRPRMAPARTSS
ncbi:MAG: phosphatase PAP2 family protein [Actinobacteria bacterium]|nr:phosphatase PAP2 family protein [Actinomycetota bacterium]